MESDIIASKNITILPSPRDDKEQQRRDIKLASAWGRINPDSVLVAAMGNHWKIPGTWAKVIDMVAHTINQGLPCGFIELQDRCYNPYDALGTMRNEAILMAMNQGWEWLCYVDNDIFPEPDMLMKLMQWQVPVIGPYVVESGTGMPVHGPPMKPNSGLKVAKWTVLSMLLFRTDVFNCTGPCFWHDAIGADEGIHFQKLYHYGHRLFIDTNVQLVVGKRPLYPLAANRLPPEERQAREADIRAKLLRPPDRRPIDPDSPYIQDGMYLPFVKPAEPAQLSPVAPESLIKPAQEFKVGEDISKVPETKEMPIEGTNA